VYGFFFGLAGFCCYFKKKKKLVARAGSTYFLVFFVFSVFFMLMLEKENIAAGPLFGWLLYVFRSCHHCH